VRKFNLDDLPVDHNILEESTIRGDIDVEQLIFRQIERTYVSALQDEAYFAANVRLLLSTVPSHKQAQIRERAAEYTSTTQTYQYKYWCGVPLGTPDKPINGSPMLVEEDVTDWHTLFELILSALEECGVTWKFEKWTIEIGRVDADGKSPMPTPNLTRAVDTSNMHSSQSALVASDVQAAEPEKYKRPCAICGGHISPGTGKFYMHRIVHKKDCFDIAKAKWVSEQENV